jgi:DNA-binding HxlR family transcriptional regulator
MRSYGQYCALARALDVIGDRWTLLIARELLLRPCRFGELADALPRVATNLLTERLRALETAGVVARTGGSPTLYELTPRGAGLAPVMHELIRWGAAEMEPRGPGEDVYRNRWFSQALEALIPPAAVTRPLIFALHFTNGDAPAVLMAEPGSGVRALRGAEADAAEPEAVITGSPRGMVELFAEVGDIGSMQVSGTMDAVDRLRALIVAAVQAGARPEVATARA